MPSVAIDAEVDARAERERGQDRELVRGVAAADVERRIGLGVAGVLRLAQRDLELQAVLRHLRQDVVARAVDDAAQRRRCDRTTSASRSTRITGMPPATAASKYRSAPRPSASSISAWPRSAISALFAVTTDLPADERALQVAAGGLDPAHHLDHDVDLGVLEQRVGVAADQRHRHERPARLVRVAHDDALDLDAAAEARLDVLARARASRRMTPWPTTPQPIMPMRILPTKVPPDARRLARNAASAKRTAPGARRGRGARRVQ